MYKKNKFSLIELLVSISIIAVLAGMVIGGLGAISEKSNVADTKSKIMLLENALLSYYQEYGEYPSLANGTLISGNIGSFEDFGNGSNLFDDDQLRYFAAEGVSTELYDSWDQGMFLIYPENYGDNFTIFNEAAQFEMGTVDVFYNQKTFQIISAGPDGQIGNGDPGTHQSLKKDNVTNFVKTN